MKKPEEILKDNPGSVIFARYAEQLAKKGDINTAIKILKKGIRTNPSYAFGHSVLAEILYEQKSLEGAAAEWKTALNIDPQIPRDLFNYGKFFLRINNQKEAQRYLTTTAKFEPDNVEIRNALEQALSMKDKPADLRLADETTEAINEVYESGEDRNILFFDENKALDGTAVTEIIKEVSDEPVFADDFEIEITSGIPSIDAEFEDSQSGEIPAVQNGDVKPGDTFISGVYKTIKNEEVVGDDNDGDDFDALLKSFVDYDDESMAEEVIAEEKVQSETTSGEDFAESGDTFVYEGHEDVISEIDSQIMIPQESIDIDQDEQSFEADIESSLSSDISSTEEKIVADNTVEVDSEMAAEADVADSFGSVDKTDKEDSTEINEITSGVFKALEEEEKRTEAEDYQSILESFSDEEIDEEITNVSGDADIESPGEETVEFEATDTGNYERVEPTADMDGNQFEEQGVEIFDQGSDIVSEPGAVGATGIAETEVTIKEEETIESVGDLGDFTNEVSEEEVETSSEAVNIVAEGITEPEDTMKYNDSIEPVDIDAVVEMNEISDHTIEMETVSAMENSATEVKDTIDRSAVNEFPFVEFHENIQNLMSYFKDESDKIETFKEDIAVESDIEEWEEVIPEDVPEFEESVVEKEIAALDSAGMAENDEVVLEIEETGEYNPATFKTESTIDRDSEPVLSNKERAELLAIGEPQEELIDETEIDAIDLDEFEKTEDSPLDDIEDGLDIPDEDHGVNITGIEGDFGKLSDEEVEMLSETENGSEEDSPDLLDDTDKGIDYSDILEGYESGIGDKTIDVDDVFMDVHAAREKSKERNSIERPTELIEDGELTSDFNDADIYDEAFIEISKSKNDRYAEEIKEIPGDHIDFVTEENEHISESPVSEKPDNYGIDNYVSGSHEAFIQSDSKMAIDVGSETLDDLYEEYVHTLNEYPEFEESDADISESINDNIDKSSGLVSSDESSAVEGATATMAEIYVSQGFVSRAIDIYKTLYRKNPDNYKLINRLQELESMSDQASEDS
ncbi:MAG: hypothetical protein JXB48_00845 [Candidatus Latescibacteria bacterium]|nr:hypothetical protein [Candidatus Latescibacterota bacterium]